MLHRVATHVYLCIKMHHWAEESVHLLEKGVQFEVFITCTLIYHLMESNLCVHILYFIVIFGTSTCTLLEFCAI